MASGMFCRVLPISQSRILKNTQLKWLSVIMILHCNLNYVTILKRELDVAFIDGDFFYRQANQLFVKFSQSPLLSLEEGLNVF